MNVLYITYLGLLEPIPQAQVLPYLYGLSKNHKLYIFSFEKKEFIQKNRIELLTLTKKFQEMNIQWRRFSYHKHPLILSSLYDIFVGFFFSIFWVLRYRIKIIHARSSVPVAIGFLLKYFFHIQLLYDRRGAMGEEDVEQSGWKHGGWLYHFSLWFENEIFKKSDAIIVLTKRMHQELSRKLSHLSSPPLIVTIPCCVDLNKFRTNIDKHLSTFYPSFKGKYVFVYSGSLGTYNLLSEMFDFFKIASQKITNAHLLILTPDISAIYKSLQHYPSSFQKMITFTTASSNDIPSFLSLADCGLLFRKNSPTAIAASPTKLGEYLASGLAVIALAHIGDVAQIVSTYKIGTLIQDYTEKEYQKATHILLELLRDKSTLKRRCRQAAEEVFSLNEGVKYYSKTYNALEELNT